MWRNYSHITMESVTRNQENVSMNSKEFVEGTIECIAADISENIRNRTVVDHILLVTPNEPLVKYVEIVDGLSGKKRELGIEKLIFQLYETIIRDATKEMFEAKIGEYQVASIKGRGQSYGKKHIKRWFLRIRRNEVLRKSGRPKVLSEYASR